MNTNNQSLLSLIFKRDIVVRSLIVAAVVGTILNLINQGDAMTGGAMINWSKCVLTYIVPYCVSTYGAVTAVSSMNKQREVDLASQ